MISRGLLSTKPWAAYQGNQKYVKNWLSVGVEFSSILRKPHQRLQRSTRRFTSRWGASHSCVAAVAVEVSASGCSVECDTPCSWGNAGEIGGDGGNGDGAASPSGLSHTAAHSQHEGLIIYGPFMGLKCLHCVNYSLFSLVGKLVHSS